MQCFPYRYNDSLWMTLLSRNPVSIFTAFTDPIERIDRIGERGVSEDIHSTDRLAESYSGDGNKHQGKSQQGTVTAGQFLQAVVFENQTTNDVNEVGER